MKKFIIFLFAVLPLIATFTSCSSDDDDEEPEVSLPGTKWESDGARTYYSYDFYYITAYDIDFVSDFYCILVTYEQVLNVADNSIVSSGNYTTSYTYTKNGTMLTLTPETDMYSSPSLICVIKGKKMDVTDADTGEQYGTFTIKEDVE